MTGWWTLDGQSTRHEWIETIGSEIFWGTDKTTNLITGDIDEFCVNSGSDSIIKKTWEYSLP